MSYRLVSRDKTVLYWIGRLRLLKTTALSAYIFNSNINVARRRLKKMVDNNFLSFIEKPGSCSRGRLERIYYLNKKNREHIRYVMGEDNTYFYSPPNNLFFVEHQLALNHTLLSLNASCKNNYSFQFFIEHETNALHYKKKNKNLESKYLDLERDFRADCMIILKNFKGQKSLVFLEIDRGTITISAKRRGKDVSSKVRAYKNYLSAERFKYLNKVFDSSFTGFRVLFITTSEARLNNIASACEEMGGLRGMLWLTTFEKITASKNLLNDSLWVVPCSKRIGLQSIIKTGARNE